MSEIAVIILAGGLSRRLGRPKQLLMLDGRPLVAHVARRALDAGVGAVSIVTGAHEGDIRAALADLPVHFVHNPRFAEGQGTSLAAGIAVLPASIDAAVILLADQPGISPETIRVVAGVRRATGAPVVMARYGEERGHPVLFGREVFSELLALEADMGGREVVRAHRDALALADGGSDAPPPDVDTEEDWAALQAAWGAGRSDHDGPEASKSGRS